MVKRGKREGRRRQGRQVLQLAVHGDAALRHAALPSCRASTSQGEVRQVRTKVGVAKGGMRKCGKSEGRLGQGRLVGVPEFGARIRDFGEIHSPQITGCKCPLEFLHRQLQKSAQRAAGVSDGASASVHHEVRTGVRHVLCARTWR